MGDHPTATDPTAGDFQPANGKRGPIPSHQLDFIAEAVVSGKSYDLIARATNLPVERVRRVVNEPTPSFQQLVDGARYRASMSDLVFRMKIRDLHDDAWQAVKRGLTQEKDPRLASEEGWKILKVCYPEAEIPGLSQNNPSLQLNVYNDSRVQSEIGKAIVNIQESNRELTRTVPDLLDRHTSRSTHLKSIDVEKGESQSPVQQDPPAEGPEGEKRDDGQSAA